MLSYNYLETIIGEGRAVRKYVCDKCGVEEVVKSNDSPTTIRQCADENLDCPLDLCQNCADEYEAMGRRLRGADLKAKLGEWLGENK